MAIAKCEYVQCIKSAECYRFLNADGAPINFKFLCGNSYDWFWKAEITTEGANEEVPTAETGNENNFVPPEDGEVGSETDDGGGTQE